VATSTQFSDGPPLGKLAPRLNERGSEPPKAREVTNVGATPYVGRFAPSPTGPLHAGSLVAALASWLDAKAHDGQWLVRIEDVDTPRCVPGADQIILQQLAACGLHPDEPPVYQSQRGQLYQSALDQLIAQSHAYPCGCSRLDIEQAIATSGHKRERHGELVYPGTCRNGLNGKKARSWRFLSTFQLSIKPLAQQIRAQAAPDSIAPDICHWTDRKLGEQQQNVSKEVGDFVLKRADGLWAYQLAVVVDDAAQGVTDVVRGEDLIGNTARQILLGSALGLPPVRYLHTPLVLGLNGEKLSKQNGATPLDTSQPLAALADAGARLGLKVEANSVTNWLYSAVNAWRTGHSRQYPR
jgi:glutamyl-Q tRNA(Asp) synthetase